MMAMEVKKSEETYIEFKGGELIFKLAPEEPIILPNFAGSVIRGAILNQIKELDYRLADELHKGNERRPYAINPLIRGKKNKRGEIIVEKGNIIEFKIKILTNKLLNKVLNMLLENQEVGIKVFEKKFNMREIEVKKRGIKIKKGVNRVKIKFMTPTYFAMNKGIEPMLFPDPTFFFMNIYKTWNQFNRSEGTVEENALYEWTKNNVILNDYATRTRRVYIGKKTPIKGFAGWAVYRVKDDEMMAWIQILAEYGKLANVGGNRTAGMGVIETKWLEEDKRKEKNKKEIKNKRQ